MYKQLVILSLCFIMKANAYTLPEHLYVIPMKHPTDTGIDLRENLDNIEIPDNFVLTFQLHKDFTGDCQEVDIKDSKNSVQAFNVCTKDNE